MDEKDSVTTQEILNYIKESDIMYLSYISDEIKMNKRKNILSEHKWKISQGKDGFWRTYLPDEIKGRKMIKKNTQREVEDIVIKYYKNLDNKAKSRTFDDFYWKWRQVQDITVVENSVEKYNTDYKRYFFNTDFSNMCIEDITEYEIKMFIISKVKSLKLCNKACKTLFGYIHNTLLYAKRKKIINEDPMENLTTKEFYKYCTQVQKPKEKKLVSSTDMKLLYQKFHNDYIKKPGYIPTYAVHLASYTGMRVGEISALRWDSITDEYIIIDKSEKYNRKTKEYYIDKTKNGKERIFPVTEEIKTLLLRVKKEEEERGYLSDFVFSNENGRIHAPVISSCLKNKCRQLGIEEKGIHALRKTFNSKMKCNGVSTTVAASLLGHSEEVNEKYYTFDTSSLKEKNNIVSQVNKGA